MINLIGTVNAEYTVYAQLHFNDCTGCVAAMKVNEDGSKSYVAWNFNTYDGELSFYWGHYSGSIEEADTEFIEKIHNR